MGRVFPPHVQMLHASIRLDLFLPTQKRSRHVKSVVNNDVFWSVGILAATC